MTFRTQPQLRLPGNFEPAASSVLKQFSADVAADLRAVEENALRWVTTVPATSASAGRQGDVTHAAPYVYLCVATDTWVRWAVEESF